MSLSAAAPPRLPSLLCFRYATSSRAPRFTFPRLVRAGTGAAGRRSTRRTRGERDQRGLADRAPPDAVIGPLRRTCTVDARRQAGGGVSRHPDGRARPSARRRQRHLLSAGADCRVDRGTDLRVERPGQHLSLLPGRRGVLGARERTGPGAGRRGVRRLRRQRAGAEVERLRRRRREGQVGDDHGQRSARARRRTDAVRRPRPHVLRTLDLQVRGGRSPGRGRGAAHPHRRIGDLSMAGGPDARGAARSTRCRPRPGHRRSASRPG